MPTTTSSGRSQWCRSAGGSPWPSRSWKKLSRTSRIHFQRRWSEMQWRIFASNAEPAKHPPVVILSHFSSSFKNSFSWSFTCFILIFSTYYTFWIILSYFVAFEDKHSVMQRKEYFIQSLRFLPTIDKIMVAIFYLTITNKKENNKSMKKEGEYMREIKITIFGGLAEQRMVRWSSGKIEDYHDSCWRNELSIFCY